jgi:hypothetical protein
MQFTNKTYDILKWVAQILIPAFAVLYLAMSKVWGLPYGNEVVATLTAIDLFLGTLLGISNASYFKSVADDGELYKFVTTLDKTEFARLVELMNTRNEQLEIDNKDR